MKLHAHELEVIQNPLFASPRARCTFLSILFSTTTDALDDWLPSCWMRECAPLLPILEESGGRFTDWQGNRTIYRGDGFSTNGTLHDTVLEVFNETF